MSLNNVVIPGHTGMPEIKTSPTFTTTTTSCSSQPATARTISTSVDGLVDGFQGLGLEAEVTPTFSIQDLEDDLANIIGTESNGERLKSIPSVISYSPTPWLFPDNDCSSFIRIAKRLLYFLTSPATLSPPRDNKEDETRSRKWKKKTSELERLGDVLELILSFSSRLVRVKWCQTDDVSKSPSTNVLERIIRNLTQDILLVIALYSEAQPWTDKNLNGLVNDLKEVWMCLNRNENLTELIVGSDRYSEEICEKSKSGRIGAQEREEPICQEGWLEKTLKKLTPELSKEKVNSQQPLLIAFLWVLESVEYPFLGGLEDFLFPPALSLLDSVETDDKVAGIRCLSEILQKIPPRNILLKNRHAVVLKALLHQMNFRDIALVRDLYPCTIVFVERYHLGSFSRKPAFDGTCEITGPSAEDVEDPDTPRNQLFSQLLFHLELESDLLKRREMLKHFGAHVRGMAISICRYLKRTVTFLGNSLDYQDDNDDTARLLALDAMCDVIRAAEPRIPHHTSRIVNPVVSLALEVVSDRYTNSAFTRDNVLAAIARVLTLMAQVAPTELTRTLSAIPSEQFDTNVKGILKAAEDNAAKKLRQQKDG